MVRQTRSAAAAARASDFFIGRERLFDRLDELHARAVWLQGPTGAGKTVLLRLYTQRGGAAVLWLAVDSADAAPAGLFARLLQAAQRAGARDLPQFAGEHRHAPAEWLRHCLDRVAQQLPGAVLVIDDAHRLLPSLAPLLATLIDSCSDRLRLLFAAQDLPLGLETLIAAAQLVVIGHEHLVLDEAEAVALARRIGAAEELAAPLRERTSGWAAGLMLALQLAQGASLANAQRRLDAPLASLVHSGVLAGLPPQSVTALAALAPARHLPLALAACGAPWAQAIAALEGLSERGLFVERVDDDLRLHDLLRNALLQEPLAAVDRDAAIAALSRVERPELALACIVAGPQQGDRLRDWLDGHGEALLRRDDIGALVAPVAERGAHLPAAVRLWCARGAMATDLELADRTAEQTHAALRTETDAAAMRQCCGIGLLAQTVLLDGQRLASWQTRLATLPPATPEEAERAPLLEIAARVVAHELQPSRLSPAEIRALHESLQRALLQQQPPQESILAASFLVHALLMQQRRQDIPALLARVEGADWFGRAPLFAQIEWHINKGFTLTGLGRLEEAAMSFAVAADLARQQGMTELLRSALAGRARTLLLIGELADAEATIREAEALPGDPGVHRRTDQLKLTAWLELARGRSVRALGAIETAERLFADLGVPPTATLQLDRTQVLYALGQHDEAIALAAQIAERTEGTVRDMAQCTRQLLTAQALWPHDPVQAAAALSDGVALIEQRRWTNFLSLLPREAGMAAQRALKREGRLDVLRDAIRERRLPAPADAGAEWPWPLRIFVLGNWRLERFDEVVQFQGKVQRKPLDLLKFLACAREQVADHAAVCAALWPDAEENAARRSLEMATARLRDMLGNAAWVRVADGRVRLDPAFVWCDAQALWHACAAAEQASRREDQASALPTAETMLALYRGPLLSGEDDAPWLIGARDRLRAAFVRAVRAVADALQPQRHELAVALMEQALAAEPLAEEIAQRLMRAYLQRGHPAEAMRVYRHLRQMLSVLLGTQPSAASEQLRRSIVSQPHEGSTS